MYNLKDIINKEIIENKQKEMLNFLENYIKRQLALNHSGNELIKQEKRILLTQFQP